MFPSVSSLRAVGRQPALCPSGKDSVERGNPNGMAFLESASSLPLIMKRESMARQDIKMRIRYTAFLVT